MANILFSLLLLVLGVFFLFSAYKINKTKDIKLDITKLINPEMLKYKEKYVKVHFKGYLILGILAITESIVGLTSCYIPSIHFAFDVLNIILGIAMIIYMFKCMSMLCKS